ncbi:MAG: hypothetical protein ABUL73_04695 [Alphaproteobacteria bacterium]
MLWGLSALALLALAYPVAWIAQETFGGHFVVNGPYAVLFVFGLGALGVGAALMALAVALFASTRRRDRAQADLSNFE